MSSRPVPRRAAAALAVAAAVLVMSACSGDSEPDGGASSTSAPSSSEPSASASASPEPTDSSPTPSEPATPTDSPTGVQTGGVAQGFPVDVVPVLPDAVVSVSTVASANGQRSVSLSGSTTLPPDQVIDFYRQALVAQGFVESAGGQAAGAPSVAFNRGGGAELLVVSVTTTGATQSFTVGGTIAGG